MSTPSSSNHFFPLYFQFDEDKSGYVDFPEFIAIAASKKVSEEREAKYIQTFQSLDKDNTGFLSQGKLLKALQNIPKENSMEKDTVKKVLAEVNRNSENELNYSDFVKALRSKNILL